MKPLGYYHNRDRWNEVAQPHRQAALYRANAVAAGSAELSSVESRALGDLRDATCLHVLCHIGTDSALIARRARWVVGLDYSLTSLDVAREIAVSSGRANLHYVCGDVEAPPLRRDTFNVIFMNWGSLVWIFDLESVFRELYRLGRPGARLVIVDQHPVALSFRRRAGSTAMVPAEPYFGPRSLRLRRRDYADPSVPLTIPWVTEARHTLAELLAAVSIGGFVLRCFDEIPSLGWPGFEGMRQVEETLWTLADSPVPLGFVLVAEKCS